MSAQSGETGRWRETSPQFHTRYALSQYHKPDYLGARNRLYWDRCTWCHDVHIHGKKISMSQITINILVATWCYQSSLRKKMAAVHFTTIPFEPNTANYTLRHIWGRRGGGDDIHPCNSNIAYPRFEVYKTFLCVFMSNSMVFMR